MSNSNENKRNELHDDWRLSAWLLNELSDSDRLEFEQLIRERPACKAELQSMQQVIDQLTNALQNEPFPEDVPDVNANGGNANGGNSTCVKNASAAVPVSRARAERNASGGKFSFRRVLLRQVPIVLIFATGCLLLLLQVLRTPGQRTGTREVGKAMTAAIDTLAETEAPAETEMLAETADVASEDASAETTGAFYTLSQRPLAMPVPASGPARQESLEEKSRVDTVQVAPEHTSGETFQRRLSQKQKKAITPNHFKDDASLRDTDSPRRSIAQFEKSKAEESMSEANADGAAFSLPAVFNSLPATGPQGQEKTIDHNAFHLTCRTDRLENSNVTIQIQLCAKAVINDLSIEVVPMESRYEAVLPAPALAANDEQTATVENRESAESAITEPSGNIAKWVQLNPGETRTIQWTYMPSPNSEEEAADPVVAVIEISGQAKDAASPFRYSFRALVTDAPNAPDQEAQ